MEITDPQAIRALAHPIRLDLLELLAAISPATAARCGRILGLPQANCSFHLRQLAKYGFAEDAGPGQDRRERQWRVPDPRPTLRIRAGRNPVVQRELERLVVERATQAILGFLDHRDGEPPTWQRSTGTTTAITTLSADDAAELKKKWLALLEPYVARTEAAAPQPGRRHVRYFMAATPLTHLDPEELDHAADR